jgi:hypothetical protein
MRYLFDLLPDLTGIFLAAVSLGVALLGKDLKWFEDHPKSRWSIAIVLALLGLGGVASNTVQKSEDKNERGALKGEITNLQSQLTAVSRKINTDTNASVNPANFVPLRGAQAIEEGLFQWNIGFIVTQNTAGNMRYFADLQIENGQGINDKKIWRKFKSVAIERMGEHGPDATIGSAPWDTLSLQLKKKDADAVMAGSRTIYALAFVQWTNPSGNDGHYPLCLWLQKPSGKILTIQNAVWHSCDL